MSSPTPSTRSATNIAQILREGEVHVWTLGMDDAIDPALEDSSVLSEDELAKARRLRFAKGAAVQIRSTAVLRRILALYVGRPPEEIRFTRGPYGKPYLDAEVHPGGPFFNMTHSPLLSLFAVARREVGIDVESLDRTTRDMDGIAARFFSAREADFLAKLSGDEKRREFFRCWTRKETYIKAIGEGLRHPLDGFSVALGSGIEAGLVESSIRPGDPARWSFTELRPRADHIGAVAVDGEPATVILRNWAGHSRR